MLLHCALYHPSRRHKGSLGNRQPQRYDTLLDPLLVPTQFKPWA